MGTTVVSGIISGTQPCPKSPEKSKEIWTKSSLQAFSSLSKDQYVGAKHPKLNITITKNNKKVARSVRDWRSTPRKRQNSFA